MATNLLAPYGLSFLRNAISGANTYQGNQYYIKNGYASNIAKGDLVKTGTGGNQGYVVLATTTETQVLGVFNGVLPYYDTNAMQTAHGLNGSYSNTAAPVAGTDIPCMVYSDPFATYLAQTNGTWAQSWRGQNINFAAGTNGAPNSAGTSTLYLDATTIATTATLPFRILGLSGISGGPQDPANENCWIEVRLNIAEMLNATGI